VRRIVVDAYLGRDRWCSEARPRSQLTLDLGAAPEAVDVTAAWPTMQVVSFLTERLQDADRAAPDGRGLPPTERQAARGRPALAVLSSEKNADIGIPRPSSTRRATSASDGLMPVLDLGDELGTDRAASRRPLREVGRLAEARSRLAMSRGLPVAVVSASSL